MQQYASSQAIYCRKYQLQQDLNDLLSKSDLACENYSDALFNTVLGYLSTINDYIVQAKSMFFS